ncbi:MAG: ATP-dependent DNA helicase RecQ, partial [Verrucomicrobiota bacterium]
MSADTEQLTDALQKHFGFSTFLEGQDEAVSHVLNGTDTVVIMPTGSGKSLCYQLTSLLLDGITIVVSPLIALMKDQVDGLAQKKIPTTFINSTLSAHEMFERLDGIERGEYKLVYVAPERFRNQRFMNLLRSINVSLLAVDEAHCISQWGHDFRPDYLRIHLVVNELPHARVMALTATATPQVREDIATQLQLGQNGRPEPQILVHGFSRPNLSLNVTRASSHQIKLDRIREVVEQHETGIIYCSTRKQTERVCKSLKGLKQACGMYHGGMSDEDRKKVQDRFMDGRLSVVAATNAFGMGVDRADLRFVIHWDIPGSIEAYYQEVGR